MNLVYLVEIFNNQIGDEISPKFYWLVKNSRGDLVSRPRDRCDTLIECVAIIKKKYHDKQFSIVHNGVKIY